MNHIEAYRFSDNLSELEIELTGPDVHLLSDWRDRTGELVKCILAKT